MIYMDPSLENAKREIDVVESYASDCWNIGFNTIWESLDIFAFAHFWGWGMKALMIRNYGICWVISVTWEVRLSRLFWFYKTETLSQILSINTQWSYGHRNNISIQLVHFTKYVRDF